MSIYDKYNIHGARLCECVGCRKHKRLQYIHGGFFCAKHAAELEDIRRLLVHGKVSGDCFIEYVYRQKELDFRKQIDFGHLHYLSVLLFNLSTTTC